MKVSIVIPTFRRPEMLRRLLTSIAAQTYTAYEVIVVDDCSPIAEYSEVIGDARAQFPRFTFLRNEANRGAPHSRNRGIGYARGPLVALVDDDDEWLPRKLERQVELFEDSGGEVGLIYTWTDVVENGVRAPLFRALTEGRSLSSMLN